MYDDIPAAPNIYNFSTDQITVYGVKLNEREEAPRLPFSSYLLSLTVLDRRNKLEILDPSKITIAVAYGYAFEGHCYRLDQPKLLIFEPEQVEEPARGCGFGSDYLMWRISQKTELLEMVLSLDLAEKLILEANLPGNRAPNTYGNSMALAHRNGRINKSFSTP